MSQWRKCGKTRRHLGRGPNSVGFFSLVWGLKLTDDEKQNLVTYMLTL